MKERLIMFYDPDCSFCKKSCENIKKFLFLKNASVTSMALDESASSIFKDEYSWSVYDDSVKEYFSKSSAWWRLVKYSPFRMGYYISKFPFIILVGDTIYDYIAHNRPKACLL